MANTYTLINSNILTSSAASVSFAAIPATYTDLKLVWSVRTDYGATRTGFRIKYNNLTSNYSETYLLGLPADGAFSGQYTGNAYFWGEYINGTGATANTFGSGEMYIPSYTTSLGKPASIFSVAEGNTTTDTGMYVKALLMNNSAVITDLTMTANTGNFVSGTSFYLYGIKNN